MDTLELLKAVDQTVAPFFALREELRKTAFQVTPSMPQPGPAQAPQQPDPNQMPQAAPPQDPNAQQPAAPPQPITPEQLNQVLEMLQTVAQKQQESEQRLGAVEQQTQAHAQQLQQHGQSLDDHDSRIAQSAVAQQPPAQPAVPVQM